MKDRLFFFFFFFFAAWWAVLVGACLYYFSSYDADLKDAAKRGVGGEEEGRTCMVRVVVY